MQSHEQFLDFGMNDSFKFLNGCSGKVRGIHVFDGFHRLGLVDVEERPVDNVRIVESWMLFERGSQSVNSVWYKISSGNQAMLDPTV